MSDMELMKAPFPYFGGKSGAADAVWSALGDVKNYVEPFFGSGAVLLARPHEPTVETVNDADGLLVNMWRALRAAPDEVAAHADWPVNEADLFARHAWLVERREPMTERLMADPDWYDAKAAGWWVWGACCWIGGGWCAGTGGWVVEDGVPVRKVGQGVSRKIPHLSSYGRGVHKPSVSRRIPHLANDGQGVHKPSVSRQIPHLANDGKGVHLPNGARSSTTLTEWFAALAARLRNVRVCCGDWSRVVSKSATYGHIQCFNGGTCGVFLDPPYGDTRKAVYAVDSTTVLDDVRAWCSANDERPNLRIVLAGFEGEHDALEQRGWRVVEWYRKGFLSGGYGNVGGADNSQMHRDRLWLSPACLAPDPAPPPPQRGLPGIE